MRNKLLVAGTLALAMTCTTVFSSITPAVVKAASVSTVQTQTAENSDDYVYCYAGLTWAEYWKAEGVTAAGDTTSSDTADSHGEKDKGAFDAVTRATANHGLHRGSYQCTAVIEGEKGTYSISHWTDANTAILTNGEKITFTRGAIKTSDGTEDTMKDYKVYGLKYVPVAVKSSDFEAFKAKYSVVENDSTLIGGYGENYLKAYEVTASVDKNTNGLKTAEKQSDGSFTFTQRNNNGSSSGIKDQALKNADLSNMGATVKSANGSYGEFLRVDFTKGYGDLGANMQAVKWTYYGNDSTRSTALATYGTKFAADNWMHKNNGIQLGLTDSIRCQLPKGYDGTGYWSLTIYALGYADSTYNFKATDANIDKYVYGTANLSYADFYYGELNDVKEDAEINLDVEDKAASYRESGMYDAVSSATTNKYKSFFSSTYSEDNTNGQGGSIIGMKDVNIAVPTSLYENAKKAISDKKECSNKLLEIISSMKLSDTTPSEYKILNGDGTLTAMKSDVTEDTSDTLTIKTQSSYGQYEVDPVTSENSPLSKLSAKDSLLGIIVEDKDGNKYGMEHLENIWVGGKFAFAVTDGFKEKHGNTIDYKRHESLQGKTIKKVTYLVKDDADIVINTDLKCKTLAGSDSIKATANDNFKDGATVSVDTTAVPSGSNYTLSSVRMGKTVLTEGADYTYANNTLTIKATDNTGVGSYSMVFTDNTFSDIVASFTLESGYKTGDISINKNNQITLPAGVSFEKYVNNITSIKINGVEKTGKGGIKATDLFDADGNINFNAAIKGKDGSSTPVFADKSASYTIELTSTGYPSVSGTVQLNTSILEASIKKAEALDSSKYTAETWKSLQTALTEAKEAKSANTQTIVDAANTKLTEALSGLKEKTVTPSKPATEKKNNTTPALKKANVKLSKPVLKVGKTTKNKAKVTWKKVKKATGYEIQYTTKGFGNQKATKTIKVSKAKITSAQLKKLKKKTRYKVRIRAVYTEAGYQTATSKWSAIKTVKTK
ncbi:fibronectin type III domain-containing protein [Anaerobutyricum soehngenii]|uniref:Fibronectin type III domain-containing protein n=1 Tax=Anaerobutyricum soehngenii TaxID=105843 RepID=A0ABS3ZF68_9FIRM|nr:penicillin-binding Tp47 domain C-containing protein [Anaerobutyricum soehngenii]MBP0055946.1 fibronectin type III domain-containing protein [Anaerobutyricum soehngenii]